MNFKGLCFKLDVTYVKTEGNQMNLECSIGGCWVRETIPLQTSDMGKKTLSVQAH